jgi:hypothetical protein
MDELFTVISEIRTKPPTWWFTPQMDVFQQICSVALYLAMISPTGMAPSSKVELRLTTTF